MNSVLNVLLLGTAGWAVLLLFIMIVVAILVLNDKVEAKNKNKSYRYWWNLWVIFTRILSIAVIFYGIFFLIMFIGIMARLPWG